MVKILKSKRAYVKISIFDVVSMMKYNKYPLQTQNLINYF